jgi:hypothetical protein
MAELDLVKVIQSLRLQLEEAMKIAEDERIYFEPTSIVLDFQVGVKSSAEAKGGVKFWVVELGGAGSHSLESIQKVTLSLSPKVVGGRAPKITEGSDRNPLSGEG